MTSPAPLGQHRDMFGEPENQFSLTRAALSTRGAQKQIPISIASLRVDHYRLTGYTVPTMPTVFANSRGAAHDVLVQRVKFEGKNACRLTDLLFHTDKNGMG